MRQVLGIVIGFVGIVLLFATTGHINFDSIEYSGYIFIATMCYGLNNNLVKHKLHGISSLTIATLSFVSLIIPAIIILIFSGYFSLPLGLVTYLRSTFASCILGIVGSALSYIMLFELIKHTTAVFASSILYITPLVALAWGWFYGESITIFQIPCLLIILAGVYLTNPIFKKAQVS
jgi:drug/metabolite transporter (DMT)-like permease